jgi:hypothetical protein
MPQEDSNYEWRVRIDFRAGIDMPLNPYKPSQMPSVYFEVAWSESIYYETILKDTKLYSLVVEDSRYPNWNQ